MYLRIMGPGYNAPGPMYRARLVGVSYTSTAYRGMSLAAAATDSKMNRAIRSALGLAANTSRSLRFE